MYIYIKNNNIYNNIFKKYTYLKIYIYKIVYITIYIKDIQRRLAAVKASAHGYPVNKLNKTYTNVTHTHTHTHTH